MSLKLGNKNFANATSSNINSYELGNSKQFLLEPVNHSGDSSEYALKKEDSSSSSIDYGKVRNSGRLPEIGRN